MYSRGAVGTPSLPAVGSPRARASATKYSWASGPASEVLPIPLPWLPQRTPPPLEALDSRERQGIAEATMHATTPFPSRSATPRGSKHDPAPWSLDTSIWSGRQYRGGENRGFYDDDSVVRRAIVCDLGKAVDKGLLLPHLLKYDAAARAVASESPNVDHGGFAAEPSSTESNRSIDAATDAATADRAMASIGQRIKEVFVTYGRVFYMIFDYFASLSGTGDLFHIHRNGYDELCSQCGIVVPGSASCDLYHLDLIFVLVNASSRDMPAQPKQKRTGPRMARQHKVRAAVKHDTKHTLTRAELMQCLCRIAVARYILTPKTDATPLAGKTDVPAALDELFKRIKSQASREVQQNGMDFRHSCCYTEATDAALRLHEPTLRLLYAKFSDSASGASVDRPTAHRSVTMVADSHQLMSPGEWVTLCRDLSLLDDDLSMDTARLIFMWSRMRVIDEDDLKNRARIENLTFWGFLEAIIRVAHSKALPTDDEVAESGYADGGDFLIGLRRDDPTAFRAFVRRNRRQWWEPTRQPIDKKLSIILQLIVRTLAERITRWERDGSVAKARREAREAEAARAKGGLARPNANTILATAAATTGQRGNGQWTCTDTAAKLLEGLRSGEDADRKSPRSLSAESVTLLDVALREQSTFQTPAAIAIQAWMRGKMGRERGEARFSAAELIQQFVRAGKQRQKSQVGHDYE